MFSKVAFPFYISSNNKEGSNFSICLPTLIFLFCFIIAILVDVKWYFIVVLIWNALMISDIKQIFTFMTICMFSLEKIVYFLYLFLIWLFGGLLLSISLSYFYVFNINIFSDIWLANIFSHFIRCLFIILIILLWWWWCRSFYFNEIPLTFCLCCL